MPRIVFALILLASPLMLSAADWFAPPDRGEVAAQVLFTCLCVMDWSQTIEMAKNPETRQESNTILGHHPSVRQANDLIPLVIAAHAFITWVIFREWWQRTRIGIKIQAVHSNWRSGMSISF